MTQFKDEQRLVRKEQGNPKANKETGNIRFWNSGFDGTAKLSDGYNRFVAG